MINLLPPQGKRRVTREYWVRVVSVWSILIASGVLLVTILHVPVYVLLQNKLDAFVEEFNEATGRKESFDESKAQIVQANVLAKLLAAEDQGVAFTTVTQTLESLAGVDVTIEHIQLQRNEQALAATTISGMATTRQALVRFRDAITAHELFDEVELPLSNLAKDRDIPFSLTISPAASLQ